MKSSKFSWTGILWQTKLNVSGELCEIGIRAKENERETVTRLEPIALRFPEFWSSYKERIVKQTAKWLADESDSADVRPDKCTVENVRLSGTGWTIFSRNVSSEPRTYFEILLEFVDENGGPLYGDGVNILVTGQLISSDLVVDWRALDFQLLVL